ncbi:MAG: glycosyltransferase [Candidatus Pacebacteria bacterium]|nr:glycosyltransferase [Candidatus Paceibacterota bacterium]
MVSVIIPAFNEEATVAGVVRVAKAHPNVGEVIVVDDGSDDATADRAREAGARVIVLPSNRGKAGAMDAGVVSAAHDIILFLDADCEGFSEQSISTIIDPVLRDEYVMYVGINSRRSFWLNRILHFFPILSGDRALRRELWHAVPQEYKERFQIEIALNYFSKQFSKGAGFSVIHGVRHIIKEQKHGFFRGFVRRLFMIKDILVIAVRLYIIRTLKHLRMRALPF